MSTDESDQGLFVLDPGVRREALPVSTVPVKKTFRAFAPDQNFLLPPSLDEWLPADHIARFIADLVDEHLGLSRIHAAYKEKKGTDNLSSHRVSRPASVEPWALPQQ